MIAASMLVAGCSQAVNGDAERPEPTRTVPSTTTSALPPATTTTTTTSAPVNPPAIGAPITEVVDWIEAATPADAEAFHTATREGVTTQLGDDVAFTTASGTPTCMTASRFDGALACLVDLTDPPPRPPDAYGEWKGDWVDFSGPTLEIGSAHGDPGRFANGVGPELPNGQSLSFGDYRCRTDAASVLCVNYAHRSAARFGAAGIETFGCLQPTDPPAGIGEQFRC